MAVQRRPKKGTDKNGKVRWVGRYRDLSGKEHSKTFKTQKEAKNWVTKQEQSVRDGSWIDPVNSKLTVKDICERWLESTTRKETTQRIYEIITRLHVAPIADIPAQQLTPQHVTQWHKDLTTCKYWSKDTKPLKESSARYAVRVLRTAFRWAVEEGLLAKNPVKPLKSASASSIDPDRIPPLDDIQRTIKALRKGEVPWMCHHAKGGEPAEAVQGPVPTIADIAETALMTGMRISEILGLVVGDVDMDTGIINVKKQLSPTGKKRVGLKSARSRRSIPIAAELAPILIIHTLGKNPDDFLFTGDRGVPVSQPYASRCMKRARDHVGAPLVHFHALRHFFASSLLGAGVPVHEVADLMGHSRTVLLTTYAHVMPGATDRARAAISSAVLCGQNAG